MVRANAATISAALAAHDTTFELLLGSDRRIQVPCPERACKCAVCGTIPWVGMHAYQYYQACQAACMCKSAKFESRIGTLRIGVDCRQTYAVPGEVLPGKTGMYHP